jgi:hypothetical protein
MARKPHTWPIDRQALAQVHDLEAKARLAQDAGAVAEVDRLRNEAIELRKRFGLIEECSIGQDDVFDD